ncbi:MAG: prepilin peptidase [Litoreibacter sp.]
MGTASSTALWFLPFVIPIAIWAAYSDLSRMKIPNVSVLALMIVFVVVGYVVLPTAEYWPRFIHFIVVFILGFFMAMFGWIGAGDAKFAAAMAPFVALSDVTFVMILFGPIALICIILHRIAKRTAIRSLVPSWESWSNTKQFPMGLPLAMTLVSYLGFAALN